MSISKAFNLLDRDLQLHLSKHSVLDSFSTYISNFNSSMSEKIVLNIIKGILRYLGNTYMQSHKYIFYYVAS